MISRILDRLSGKEPCHRRHVLRRLQPVEFKLVAKGDIQTCLNIHQACETHYLPTAHRPIFQTALESDRMLMLLAYLNNQVVGCCGLERSSDTLAWLCYGLVLPEHRNRGIGTTMFFARMSLLDQIDAPVFTVGMSAIAENFPFYANFGFYMLSHIPNPCADGNNYPVALLENMNTAKARHYRQRIVEAGVKMPDEPLAIPAVPPAQEATTAD